MGLFSLLVLLGLGLLLAGQLGWLAGRTPDGLGVNAGRLKAPSTTLNSVSSQARLHTGHAMADAAWVAPHGWRRWPTPLPRLLTRRLQ